MANNEKEVRLDKSGGLTRRGLFRLGAGLAGAKFGADLVSHELDILDDNTFWVDGIGYYPMYEEHTEGPQISIPPSASAVFMERNVSVGEEITTPSGEVVTNYYDIYDVPLRYLEDSLVRHTSIYNRESRAPGRIELLDSVKRFEIPVALGDIVEPLDMINADEPIFYRATIPETEIKVFWEGVATAIVSQVPQEIIKYAPQVGIDRRDVLKGLGLGAAALSLGGAGYGLWRATDSAAFRQFHELAQTSPIFQRIYQRVTGLASHLHQEYPTVFIRNALMTLKSKLTGEHFRQQEEDPVIAYNIGKAHNGVEDMFYLPNSVLRLILAHGNQMYINSKVATFGPKIATVRMVGFQSQTGWREFPPLVDRELLSMLGTA